MPWKESSVMEERLCFVARLLDGEPMTEVCRDFGISRKTGYKILTAITNMGCRPSPIVRAGPCATPTSSRRRSKA